ncbi:Uu.00g037190.m01.CDS01 [Anthostomella pinea]|uniref:Uu.00g037190.m01.CDS01 n=1 Tax=Anthostomella pinea TaxID=933095 RepID=A0AAI8YDJ0_9PEZI|nr:Uu.00g037190.m01.CDS01 [Anthostomella pinea]
MARKITSANYKDAASTLTESNEHLLEPGLFADVKVKCGDRTWNLHRAIICLRCPYFEKAFVPSGLTDKYPITSCLDLLKVADFFQVDLLVDEIATMMRSRVEQWAGVVQRAGLLYLYNPSTYLSDAQVDEFFQIVQVAYDSSYAAIQEQVKAFVPMTRYHVLKDARFLAALEDIPDFAVDVVKLLIAPIAEPRRTSMPTPALQAVNFVMGLKVFTTMVIVSTVSARPALHGMI